MATSSDRRATPLQPTPLVIVNLALRDTAYLSNLPHVLHLVSTFMDDTVNIPLHKACAIGSLAPLIASGFTAKPLVAKIGDGVLLHHCRLIAITSGGNSRSH
ncbi:hypothetical protein GN958_ATG02434 [Phytophthora infestans]|uniref:Uncharacterized protein n=1 Tax=Phytophthora infestans TaxID=4787 RepID=A0A8S9V5Y6_PHYIN|nr:hypothetical protein GN958_ATG08987 [Phytophthora infestans]KAF4148400.1 hypothetical protein GN958_ATG02434 [Phytophthora infestans]